MRLSQKERKKRKFKHKHTREIIGPTLTWSFWCQEIVALLAMDCLSGWYHYSRKGNWIYTYIFFNTVIKFNIYVY